MGFNHPVQGRIWQTEATFLVTEQFVRCQSICQRATSAILAETHGEYMAKDVTMPFAMARRPDFGKEEEIWTREELNDIARNLAVLSEPAVGEVYQRAYRECAIINSRTFPSARAIQELVMAWKILLKWRR
jgi:hypothetical protein